MKKKQKSPSFGVELSRLKRDYNDHVALRDWQSCDLISGQIEALIKKREEHHPSGKRGGRWFMIKYIIWDDKKHEWLTSSNGINMDGSSPVIGRACEVTKNIAVGLTKKLPHLHRVITPFQSFTKDSWDEMIAEMD